MLDNFRDLKCLRIEVSDKLDDMFPSGHNSPAMALPSLRHLKLVNVEIKSKTGLVRLLEHLTTPAVNPDSCACAYIYEGLVSIPLRPPHSVCLSYC